MVKTRRFRGGKNSTRQYKQKKHHSTHRRKVKRYSRRGTKRRRRKRTKRVKRGGWRGGNKARYQVVGYKRPMAHGAQLISKRRVEWVSSGWASPNNKKFITNSINSNKKLKEYLTVELLKKVADSAKQTLIPLGGQVSRVSLSENLTQTGWLTRASAAAVEKEMIVFPVKISWTRKQDALPAGQRGGTPRVHWAGVGPSSMTTDPLVENYAFTPDDVPNAVRRDEEGEKEGEEEGEEKEEGGSFHVFIKRCVCRENECMSFLKGGTNWPDQAEMLNINTIIGKECPILERKVRTDYGSSVYGQ